MRHEEIEQQIQRTHAYDQKDKRSVVVAHTAIWALHDKRLEKGIHRGSSVRASNIKTSSYLLCLTYLQKLSFLPNYPLQKTVYENAPKNPRF